MVCLGSCLHREITDVIRKRFLDDFSKYAYRQRSSGEPWRTVPSIKAFGSQWMLASSMSSFSEIHVDASGYCTAVIILKGSKLWNILPEATSELPGSDEEWTVTNDGWCSAFLKSGDILYDLCSRPVQHILTSHLDIYSPVRPILCLRRRRVSHLESTFIIFDFYWRQRRP